jgi:ADP-ribosyl-[dinitrogen reductase] hydrolase
MNFEKSLIGCLLGTAIGDALGLTYEGLSKQRIKKISPEIKEYHFFFNKGMVSDDTEHLCFVAQSLIVSAGNERKFLKSLAWRLRFWLLGLPAGVGLATLRSIVKLWLGFSPTKSGVFSAGNGAAMRSSILGVCYGNDPEKLANLVKLSTHITHSDPKAEYGAFAVAIAAYLASQDRDILPVDYYNIIEQHLPVKNQEFLDLIRTVCQSIEQGEATETFAISLGLNKGITGYIYHTVPIVIHVWLRSQNNYQTAISEIIKLGGDTDTTAAILGGIIGARVGKEGIPQQWLDNFGEYPRNIQWLEKLGQRLTIVMEEKQTQNPLFIPVYLILVRNILFLMIVIFHGFRRLFPPY